MKKTLMAVALSMISIGALASESITISYQLTKDGEVISKASSSVEEGHELPFFTGTQREYIKSATHDGYKKILSPGVVSTGFKMSVTPRMISGGKIFLNVKAEQVDLIAMDKAMSDNLEIEMPRIDTFKILQKASLTSGKPFEFSLGENEAGNKYVLVVTASNGENDTLKKTSAF